VEHLSRCSTASAFFIDREDAMGSITWDEPRNRMNSEGAKQRMHSKTPLVSPPLLPIAPKLILLFWMLLGAVAGVTLAQAVWKLAGLTTGAFAFVVTVGAVGGAVGGKLALRELC
jgi:hypothetical protein